MKTNLKTKLSLYILCLMFAATAFFTTGCSSSLSKAKSPSSEKAPATGQSSDTQADSNVLGQGDTQFQFTVIDIDGNETAYEIHTDKETVGEALEDLGLIEGEESEYGLFVKTVNGITIDPDKDNTYWAFYIDDEYAQTGVDSTAITPGANYSFKVEKA